MLLSKMIGRTFDEMYKVNVIVTCVGYGLSYMIG